MLQETDIIAEGRIKPRNAPAPAQKEGEADASAEAPADTVAPAEEASAPTEEPKPEAAAGVFRKPLCMHLEEPLSALHLTLDQRMVSSVLKCGHGGICSVLIFHAKQQKWSYTLFCEGTGHPVHGLLILSHPRVSVCGHVTYGRPDV